MSEVITPRGELWLDGPNYTADAVIVDEERQKILLIERRDCGEWALPGGFVDKDESADVAARREANEEASVELPTGELVFHGIVDDPRNSERAWIETSAYLFNLSSDTDGQAGDDARDARWFSLDNLPPLYASHRAIIDRALDALASKQQLEMANDATCTPVSGGHMNYSKYLAKTAAQDLFVKTYDSREAPGEHILCLQKEAAIMSHLRTNGFIHVPRASHMANERTLVMEAYAPDDGWQWRAPTASFDQYVRDCLEAFQTLEQQSLPADTHNIASSFVTQTREGWEAIAQGSLDKLSRFATQIRLDSQNTAARLFDHFDELQFYARLTPLPDEFVLCHHDARQANIAWHQTRGVRLIDWSWADIGRPGSDATTLLIDLHKHGHDITPYLGAVNPDHCLTMIGFWLEHASWPIAARAESIRLQQFISALAGYEILEARGFGV